MAMSGAVSLVLAAAVSAVQPATNESAIEIVARALAEGRPAPTALLKQVVKRSRDLSTKPDAEVDGIAGLSGVATSPAVAIISIDRALAAGPSPREAIVLRMARAEALDRTDAAAEAEALWRQVADDVAADADERRTAWYALARRALARADEAAVAAARQGLALARTDGDRWEGHLLLARAYGVASRRAEAAESRAAAWATAVSSPVPHGAIVATAGDLGVEADRQGDKLRAYDLLKIAGTAGRASSLSRHLPNCSDRIAADDAVTISFGRRRYGGLSLLPIAASRPQAVGPVTAALGVYARRTAAGSGTARLRCRTGVYDDYRAPPEIDVLGAWMLSRGLRPYAIDDAATPAAVVNALHERIASLRIAGGADDPALIAPMLQLATTYHAQVAMSGPQYQPAMKEALADVRRLLVANRAPPEVLAVIDRRSRFTAASPEAMRTVMMDTIADAAARKDRTALLEVRDALEENDSVADMLPAALTALAAAYDAAGIRPDGPEGRALAFTRIAAARRADQPAAVAPLVRRAGIPPDQCNAMDRPADGLEAVVTTDDYPDEAIRAEAEGHVAVQFDVDRGGKATNARVIVSTPAGIFDEVVLKKFAVTKLKPAERGGRATACTGAVATFTFRLPNPGETGDAEPAPEPGT